MRSSKRWTGFGNVTPHWEANECSEIAIGLTVKALAASEKTSFSEKYETKSGLKVCCFDDCVYKDFFSVRFERIGDFSKHEIASVTNNIKTFFGVLGCPVSVSSTYYKAKRRFSPYCTLQLFLNFKHCYDNEASRRAFSGAGPFVGVPAPQNYFQKGLAK